MDKSENWPFMVLAYEHTLLSGDVLYSISAIIYEVFQNQTLTEQFRVE